MHIEVLIASYNRRETTLLCLATLSEAARYCSASFSVTLFDDGSEDGTASAVKARFPKTDVLHGDGGFFWARSMASAEGYALQKPRKDVTHLLWLNDDVKLDPKALASLVNTAKVNQKAILVGATVDPEDGQTTYSGLRRSGFHPLSHALVEPDGSLQSIDTFNGNFVLVPVEIAEQLRGIDGEYAHALADIDYGARARRAEVPLLLLPEPVGTCPRNPPRKSQGLVSDWKHFISRKGGGHFRSMMRFLSKAAGPAGVLYAATTYGLWWYRHLCGIRQNATR